MLTLQKVFRQSGRTVDVMDPRSSTLLAVTVLAVLSAGCLSGGPLASGDERTPTHTPAAVPTDETPATDRSPETPTQTAFSWQEASNEPDPSKSVRLENDWDRNVSVNLRVVRNATNETVHEETYRLSPDEYRTVYDTGRASPDGVEEFTFVVSVRNQTQTVSIETNACYGNAAARIDRDGELGVFYAIC